MIFFTVMGNPIPTGRPRVTSRGTFLPKASRDYQKLVALAAKRAMSDSGEPFPEVGPVSVRIRFVRGNRRACDLDNLGKSILDGLTQAGVWEDDAQVEELHVYKHVDPEHPRAEVHVYRAELVDTTVWGALLEPQP